MKVDRVQVALASEKKFRDQEESISHYRKDSVSISPVTTNMEEELENPFGYILLFLFKHFAHAGVT